MLKRFISYYKPHKKMFLLDMLASFFISAIGMTYPIITRTMLNDLIPNRNIQMKHPNVQMMTDTVPSNK